MRSRTCFYALASTLLLAATTFGQSNQGQNSGGVVVEPIRYRIDSGDTKSYSNHNLESKLRTLEMRLAELEAEKEDAKKGKDSGDYKKLKKDFDKLSKSVEKVQGTLPGLVYHGHKNPKLQFFGRIHVDYWGFLDQDPGINVLEGGNDPQDRFNFRRMRIGVKGDLTDNMFYKYEGEFAGGEASSYRDAIIGFKNLPIFHKVQIGNHKRPYGLDHLNSSRHNIFIERPFIIEAFNQDARRMGISSEGFSENMKWNWRYGVYNQRLTQTQSGFIGDNLQAEFAARIAMTPWYDEQSGGRGYAHFALSGSFGSPDGQAGGANESRYRTRPEARSSNRWLDTGRIVGADRNQLVGVESVLNVGSLNLTSEYQATRTHREAGFGSPVDFQGGYVQAAYFLTGEHMPWNRKNGTLNRVKPLENFFWVRNGDCSIGRGWGAWQVAARYSYADLSDDNIQGGVGESFTFGVNWLWNPYARVQFNYINGTISDSGAAPGSHDYDLVGVRFMVDF